MPLPKMHCTQCGREFYVLQAIQRVFCSPECRYLNNKGLPPFPWIMQRAFARRKKGYSR